MKRIIESDHISGLALTSLMIMITVTLWGCGSRAQQLRSDVPALEQAIVVRAAGEPISVDVGHAAPFVYDFDRDGRKDLIVGQFRGGTARIYLNVGTDAEPRFEGYTLLQADGEDAAMQPS